MVRLRQIGSEPLEATARKGNPLPSRAPTPHQVDKPDAYTHFPHIQPSGEIVKQPAFALMALATVGLASTGSPAQANCTRLPCLSDDPTTAPEPGIGPTWMPGKLNDKLNWPSARAFPNTEKFRKNLEANRDLLERKQLNRVISQPEYRAQLERYHQGMGDYREISKSAADRSGE